MKILPPDPHEISADVSRGHCLLSSWPALQGVPSGNYRETCLSGHGRGTPPPAPHSGRSHACTSTLSLLCCSGVRSATWLLYHCGPLSSPLLLLTSSITFFHLSASLPPGEMGHNRGKSEFCPLNLENQGPFFLSFSFLLSFCRHSFSLNGRAVHMKFHLFTFVEWLFIILPNIGHSVNTEYL